jgi:nickel-dependent lactate racemase
MKQVELEYGDGKLTVELPDSATVVRYGETYVDPPTVDPVEATRRALASPLGTKPLRELVGPGSRVVVAFPDRVKGGMHARTHRKAAIPIILEELRSAGVKEENVRLLCAVGLHRKNTREEFDKYLPKAVVDEFWPDRFDSHDAEDPDGILDLGLDSLGSRVEVNREVAEADLAILIGHAQGNPYGGYSGGYKMLATGLTTWRSIRCHHTPGSLYRHDFVPATTNSHFRAQLDSIGQTIEAATGKRFFAVDAVVDTNAEVLGVYAGSIDEVQRSSWRLADRRTNVYLDAEKADVLVFGLPRSFHYGPGMGTNPVLVYQAIGATLSRVLGAFRSGGVVIAPALLDGWFNDDWFPSYREVHGLFQRVVDPEDLVSFEEEISARPEYVRKYRDENAYHPFHAFSMLYMGGLATRHASAVFVPGAKDPGLARGMGLIPTRTFDEALRAAERYVGRNPRILALPEYLVKVPAHLWAMRG